MNTITHHHRRHRTGIFASILVVALASLVSLQAQARIFNTGPPLFRLALGGTVSLNDDIEVPQGARIHIQNGRVMEYRDLQQLNPYCYFYSMRSRSALEQPFRVQSGQFQIDNVERRLETVLSEPIMVAGLSPSLMSGGGSQYTLATRFNLNSPEQPDPLCLVCAVWADPHERGHPTLEEIQGALGSLVKFEIPAS
jgi:hypothetical protein